MAAHFERQYFFRAPPERYPDTPMLRVEIDSIEGSLVRARLHGPFARLSPDGRVLIRLSGLPSSSCDSLGPTEGPVFVIGRLVQYASGFLELEALLSRQYVSPRVQRRRDPARHDRYIVDPAYLSPPERRRREARPQ